MRCENRYAVNKPQVVRELKRDLFGRIELLEGPSGRAIRRVAGGGRNPLVGSLARLLLRREAVERLAAFELRDGHGIGHSVGLERFGHSECGHAECCVRARWIAVVRRDSDAGCS